MSAMPYYYVQESSQTQRLLKYRVQIWQCHHAIIVQIPVVERFYNFSTQTLLNCRALSKAK